MHYKKLISISILPLIFLCPLINGSEPLTPLIESLVEVAGRHKEDPSKAVPLIAIGGCPGVGKTHLTKELLNTLQNQGVHCIALSLDHFNLSPGERKKIGHFKASELQDCLASIFSGEKIIKKPTCNQLTGEIGSELLDLSNIDLILFDGLYALCSNPPLNFFDYCLLGVFLEADKSDIYRWKWEREQKKTQPRTQEQFVKHMEALLLEYTQNIEYSRKNATFLIRKNAQHQLEVHVLKTPLLRAA